MWTLKTYNFPAPLLFGAAAVLLTVLVGWWHKMKKTNSPPRKWRCVGKLSELTVFPVKSCGGIDLQEAECSECGIQTISDGPMKLRDRYFVVYNERAKEFTTARTYPKMVLINVSVDGTDAVKLSAPNMPDLQVKVPQASKNNKHTQIKFWYDDMLETVDCGDTAAQWLSKYLLNQDCGMRLGYHLVDISQRKFSLKKYTPYYKTLQKSDLGAYSDLCSFMLMTESSVADLKTRTSSDVSVVPRQFRPNFVVSGSVPYEEDKWEWIKIGETAVFRNVKPCTRCVFTTINPVTGVMDPKREPLRTLKGYRQLKGDPDQFKVEGSSPALGIFMGLYSSGIVRVGDSVFVGDE